ncbi:MAG: hypothetical protein ACI84O_000673 [Myxococcota bacterium]|jgi:hypothetical protein
MQMHHNANLFAKALTALALLLSFSLVGQTCSTKSPTVVFDPDRDDDEGGGGEGGGGGGGSTLPDQGASAPEHGSLILAGRPLILDAAPNMQTVDCHSVISIYYSESMKANTVTNGSFELREKTFGTLISTSPSTWLMANRLLIVQPQFVLTPNTTYQLTANDGPVDLDGLAYDPGLSPVLLEFTTAATVDGVPPTILATYPLDSSIDQTNDSQAVVVFSKQIDTTTISASVSLSNQTTSFSADYDTTAAFASRHAGDRVFSFDHNDDANDLAANLQLNINTTIADSSISHLFLANSYQSNWLTMSLQRPQEIQLDNLDFDPFVPAANLANYQLFPLQVLMPVGSLATDPVVLRIHQYDENNIEDERLVTAELVAGAGLVNFDVDLTATLLGVQAPVFEAVSEMLLAAYTERGGLRTAVVLHLNDDAQFEPVIHDLIPPAFTQFGPPFGSFLGQFRSSLPVVRPYGLATESLGKINLDVAGDRVVPVVSEDNFFIANSFDPAPAAVTEGPEPFVLELTDAVGNTAFSPVTAEAHFSGFVGGNDLATASGIMRIVALDANHLFPIGGATVHIEDFGGGNEDFAISGSGGSVTFSGRVGAQTVTIQRLGWHATTLVGVDASIVSLPLSPESSIQVSVSPQILNLTSGISQIGSNTLATSAGDSDEFMIQYFDLDQLFGDFISSAINRPGWFVAFHDVESFSGPIVKRYFRFVGVEERIITAPSTASGAIVPTIAMAESSNTVAPSTNYIYPVVITAGSGFTGAPVISGVTISTVIPGLSGPVVVGAGSLDLSIIAPAVNGAAELEINLLSEAIAEGADSLNVNLNVYAADASGNQVSAMVAASVATSPASAAVSMPDVPTTGGAWAGGTYPFTATFSDTLNLSEGMYEIVITDSSVAENVWDVYVMRSAASAGSIVLPSLLDAPGGLSPLIPLSTAPSVSWRAYTSAYEMAPAFSEIGFFLNVIKRDRISWAKSAVVAGVVSF